jgi:FkbM family methyltransferase
VDVVRQVFQDHQYAVGFNQNVSDRVKRRYQEILAQGQTPIIVDAGANIGAASVWFAEHYPKAQIIGIEPEPGNFAILQKNASLRSNITAVQAAIGARQGFATVDLSGLGWAATTKRSDSGIPIITMAQAFQGGVPFIAKVDIEGFESDLFRENTEWLAETFVVFIEPHDWLFPQKNTSRTFQAAMGTQDYEIYLNGEILTYVRR